MSAQYSNTRPALSLSEALTLPQSYYTDPAWFQREMEAIHSETWLCAGRTSRIPEPGGYFLRQVGNAKIIITRDEQRAIRAFHNVCRHRGTFLITQSEGQCSGRSQCPYHAWTHRLDGTL